MSDKLATAVITVAVTLNVSFLRFYPESCLFGYGPFVAVPLCTQLQTFSALLRSPKSGHRIR